MAKKDAPAPRRKAAKQPEAHMKSYPEGGAKAPTNHPTQYFEMLGNRGIIHEG